MSEDLQVGVIGCGNISSTYMKLAPMFHGIRIQKCADLDSKAAGARAQEFGLEALSVENLLNSDDLDIVVNLTIPSAHFEVSKKILQAGKHVYSEKPFVLSLTEAKALKQLASENGLRIGSAPDTFLGGAHQHARHLIDNNEIGNVTSGTAHVMDKGMEHWHPDPDFFFKPGAGPMFDLGPYYITNLIQLIGPVKRVAAISSTPSSTRTITSQPRSGEKISVDTPTTFHALLAFENGATITLGASWDVHHHGHFNMELYGEEGTLYVPDPNYFGGVPKLIKGIVPVEEPDQFAHPFSLPNADGEKGKLANYRGAGLADMALSIINHQSHRCSLEMAIHAVDVLNSIRKSGEDNMFIDLTTTCARPEPLGIREAQAMLR